LFGFDQVGLLLGVEEICLLEKVAARFQAARYYPAPLKIVHQCQELLLSAPSANTLEHRVHLLKVVSVVISEQFEQVRKEHEATNNRNGDFAHMMRRLSLDDVQDLSVEDLAKKMGYSRRHLNRLFQEHLGTSVSSLKMEARLVKSLCLLRDPQAKIIDIAMECGFNHLGLFSQCFKRRFDISPNRWRQRESARTQFQGQSDFTNEDCRLQSKGLCIWANLQKGKPVSNCGQSIPCPTRQKAP
jgi:AraC-like DNA-binding protein